MIIHLQLKGLPKRTNNMASNWRARMAEARKWKEAVYVAALQSEWKAGKPLINPRLTLIRHSSKECDFDGLVSSFKHVIDGLTKVGMITDDKISVIGVPTYIWRKSKPKQGMIEIFIEGEYE